MSTRSRVVHGYWQSRLKCSSGLSFGTVLSVSRSDQQPTMPLPVALQTRLAKRGILKHLEPGEKTKSSCIYHVPVLTDVLLFYSLFHPVLCSAPSHPPFPSNPGAR